MILFQLMKSEYSFFNVIIFSKEEAGQTVKK
jgi:hypothetical protein